MPMTTLQLRTALCARGYAGAVIPCDGKRPTAADWQGPISNDEWSMARWRGTNTGLKTARNPVADIDIIDPEAADLVRAHGQDLFRRPRHHPDAGSASCPSGRSSSAPPAVPQDGRRV